MRCAIQTGAHIARQTGESGQDRKMSRRRMASAGMAHPARFELTTSAFGGQRSIQLSYGCLDTGARGASRSAANILDARGAIKARLCAKPSSRSIACRFRAGAAPRPAAVRACSGRIPRPHPDFRRAWRGRRGRTHRCRLPGPRFHGLENDGRIERRQGPIAIRPCSTWDFT